MPSLDLTANYAVAYASRSERNPKKKTQEWIKQNACAYISDVLRNNSTMWYGGRDHYARLDTYAEGVQDTLQYRRTKRGKTNDPVQLGQIVDQSPLPILPIKLHALEAMLEEREYDPTISVSGSRAAQEIERQIRNMEKWQDAGQFARQMGMRPSQDGLPEQVPADEDEMREWVESIELDAAIALEEKLALCLDRSRYKQLAAELRQQLLRHGLCLLHDKQIPGQAPTVVRVSPDMALMLTSRYADCRDWWAGAYLENITLEQLRSEVEAGKALDPKLKGLEQHQWKALETHAASLLTSNMGTVDPAIGLKEDTATIQVVRVFFLSDDDEVQQVKPTSKGNPKTYRKPAGFKNESDKGRVVRRTITNLYEATLVVGMDIAYNCRKSLEQGRDLANPLKARLPFAAYVAGRVGNKAISVVDHCISIVNDMERSIRMWRADMKTYVPEGFNIDPDVLKDIPLKGADGKPLSAQEAYEFFLETGTTFGKRVNDSNEPLGLAVVKNPGGVPTTAGQHWNDFWNSMQLLEVITGANAVASAATPKDGVGKGVQEQALMGTQNVLKYLFRAQESVHETIFRNLAGRIKLTEHRSPVTGTMSLPGGASKQVGPYPDLFRYDFTTGIEPRPTPEEWVDLYDTAKLALQQGVAGSPDGIDFEDYLFVRRIPNLKKASRELARRIKRRRKRLQQESQQLQQQNGDVQNQSLQAKSQADMQLAQATFEQNMQIEQFRRETQWGAIEKQTEATIYLGELGNQTKLTALGVQEQGKTDRENLKVEHKLTEQVLGGQQRADEQLREAALAPEPTSAAA
ncbi:hypothetical protein [Hymenobacter metallicola]|uniref:Uncharacterized protein n=1 Tax=Hymenobacter metallicola TaxID=2563114 RepID=A0A4Z0QL98_9BACT|nr:hypothetical protein [Hymenobacter metallicola]TGE29821.1 hypothetical protein E5K02_10280 [Hymenobacter metallicola]